MANRPKPLVKEIKNKKITVKLFKEVKKALPLHILNDGYNMREKSQWVADAIGSLISNLDWESVLLSEIDVKPDAQDAFSLPNELMLRVGIEIRRINQEHPSLDATQSSIIRAAINRRLLGFYNEKPQSPPMDCNK